MGPSGSRGSAADWVNWAGNQRAVAHRSVHPASTEEVSEEIRRAGADGLTVKAIGSGHSFTPAAVTEGVRLHLDRLSGPVRIDPVRKTATVPAGMRLRELNSVLAANGLAMPNLGDIDAQTVSGAISTGTHGTGASLGGLATFVTGLTLVTGSGEVISCTKTERPEVFSAARVCVGALGVLTEVTLRCVDSFTLRAEERPESLADALAALDDRVAGNDHFELFWFPYTERVQVKINNRVPASDQPLGRFRVWLADDFLSNTVFAGACRLGRAIPALVPAISGIEARALSPRVYTAPSYQVFCTPRRVRFLEMEYALPRPALREALDGLRRILADLPIKVIFPVEVRVAAGDDIWLSHGYGRDTAYVAIHQYAGMPFEPYFRAFERLARSLAGRPHWGKMHWRERDDLRPVYPRFDDFLAVRDKLDPERRFANRYTERIFGP